MGITNLWAGLEPFLPNGVYATLPDKKITDGAGAISVDMGCVMRSLPVDVITTPQFLSHFVWNRVVGFAKTQFCGVYRPVHYFVLYDNKNTPACRKITHSRRARPQWDQRRALPAGKVLVNGKAYGHDAVPFSRADGVEFSTESTILPSLKRTMNTPEAFEKLGLFIARVLLARARTECVHMVIFLPGRTAKSVCSFGQDCVYGCDTRNPIVYGEADLIAPCLLRWAVDKKYVTSKNPMWVFNSTDTDNIITYCSMPERYAQCVRWVKGTRRRGACVVHMGRLQKFLCNTETPSSGILESRLAALLCLGSDYVTKPKGIPPSGIFSAVFDRAEFRPFLLITKDQKVSVSNPSPHEIVNACQEKEIDEKNDIETG